jgi:hypothetical protein
MERGPPIWYHQHPNQPPLWPFDADASELPRLPWRKWRFQPLWAAEVRVVKNVEELGSETKPPFLGEVELALQCKIHLRCSETPQHIAPEITLLCGGRCGKRRWIESLAARILRSIEHKRHSSHDVRTGHEGDPVSKNLCRDNITTGGAELKFANQSLASSTPFLK